MATLGKRREHVSGEVLSASPKDTKLRVENEHSHRSCVTVVAPAAVAGLQRPSDVYDACGDRADSSRKMPPRVAARGSSTLAATGVVDSVRQGQSTCERPMAAVPSVSLVGLAERRIALPASPLSKSLDDAKDDPVTERSKMAATAASL